LESRTNNICYFTSKNYILKWINKN
jgi:hypothetical protein